MAKKKTKKSTEARKPETTEQALNRVARSLNKLVEKESTLSINEFVEILEDVAEDLRIRASTVAERAYKNVRDVLPAGKVLSNK